MFEREEEEDEGMSLNYQEGSVGGRIDQERQEEDGCEVGCIVRRRFSSYIVHI